MRASDSAIRSFSFGNVFDITTTGIFGSIEYDFNDQFTLSVEARRQEDDLTEETEEIVLKRAKHDVEYAEYSLENSRDYNQRTLAVTIPRRLQQVKDAARKAAIELERFQATDPLSQRQKELTVEKLEREQRKLEGTTPDVDESMNPALVDIETDVEVDDSAVQQG